MEPFKGEKTEHKSRQKIDYRRYLCVSSGVNQKGSLNRLIDQLSKGTTNHTLLPSQAGHLTRLHMLS